MTAKPLTAFIVRVSRQLGAVQVAIIWTLNFVLLAEPSRAEQLRLFTLGSGEVAGSYYTTARAICDAVNRAERGDLRCSPDPTSGSIYNLKALRDGQIDFALVQSDWHRKAFKGTGLFARSGPLRSLRSVMSLNPEAITILARGDATIIQPRDLPGKRVDIGHPASGRRATNDILLRELGLSLKDFSQVLELPLGGVVDEICAGRLDASILILGHPNARVDHALSKCSASLIPVRGPGFDRLLLGGADYVHNVIPGAAYQGLINDVPTYAVISTLVTLASTDPAIVKTLVTRTLEQLPRLMQSASMLDGLEPKKMQRQGLTAPLHPGAQVAFDSFKLNNSQSRVPLR